MHRSFVLASVIGIAAIAGAHLAACSSSTTTTTTGDDGGGGDSATGNDSTTGTDGGGDDSATGTDGGGDDSATGTDGGGDDSATGTDGGGDDSATGADGAGDDSATGGDSGCITLTVMNAPVTTPWCKISVAGGTATTDATQTVCVPSGTSVALTATPESATFELAPKTWHDTTGDTGSGDPGTVTGMTSATHVVVTSKKTCVWACCPFSSDGSGCPTADQCP